MPIQSAKPKSLQQYAETRDESQIVNAVENSMVISNCHTDKIVELVSKWIMYIGIPKNDISEEITLVSAYIFQKYGFLTIGEIELAIELSLSRLSDVQYFGQFAPMYVSKVLESYLYYRKMTLADPIRRKQKDDMEAERKASIPSKEKQANEWKIMVMDYYKEWKATGEIRDVFSLLYYYLRRCNMMKINQERIIEAQIYGKKKVSELKKDSIDDILAHNTEKGFSRNYCVQRFFEDINIITLVNNIKPEHFDDSK